jgi:hypothetical protein
MSKVVKINIYKTMVKPVVYGSETQTITAVDMNRLVMWEGNILRMIFGPVGEQGIWRI